MSRDGDDTTSCMEQWDGQAPQARLEARRVRCVVTSVKQQQIATDSNTYSSVHRMDGRVVPKRTRRCAAGALRQASRPHSRRWQGRSSRTPRKTRTPATHATVTNKIAELHTSRGTVPRRLVLPGQGRRKHRPRAGIARVPGRTYQAAYFASCPLELPIACTSTRGHSASNLPQCLACMADCEGLADQSRRVGTICWVRLMPFLGVGGCKRDRLTHK
jgi:hypothetical protein